MKCPSRDDLNTQEQRVKICTFSYIYMAFYRVPTMDNAQKMEFLMHFYGILLRVPTGGGTCRADPYGRRTDIKLLSVRRPHGRTCGRFNCPCGRTDAAQTPHGH